MLDRKVYGEYCAKNQRHSILPSTLGSPLLIWSWFFHGFLAYGSVKKTWLSLPKVDWLLVQEPTCVRNARAESERDARDVW